MIKFNENDNDHGRKKIKFIRMKFNNDYNYSNKYISSESTYRVYNYKPQLTESKLNIIQSSETRKIEQEI